MPSFRASIQLLRTQNIGSMRVCLRSLAKNPLRDEVGFSTSLPTCSAFDGFTAGKMIKNPCGSLTSLMLSRMSGRSPLDYPMGMAVQMEKTPFKTYESSISKPLRSLYPHLVQTAGVRPPHQSRSIATTGSPVESTSLNPPPSVSDVSLRIKFKRLDKTAKHIMQILDKEAVEEVRSERDIPDIKPGYIVQLKVEVPENKRRVSILKGIVIARRNAGLNSTFRIRRLVAGVGVESMFSAIFSKHKRDKDFGEEESEEGQTLLSQGQNECTEEALASFVASKQASRKHVF